MSDDLRVTLRASVPDAYDALAREFADEQVVRVERRCENCEEGMGSASAAECPCDAGWVEDR